MVPDSQIRVIQQSPGQFVAYDPPYTVFGILFIGIAVFVVLLMVFVTWKTGGSRPVYLVGYVAAGLLLLMGAAAASATGYISASEKTGEIQTRRRILGANFEGEHIRLREVQLARVEDMKNLHRVVLVLKTGQTVSLTSATDRDGYDSVAQAINRLLGH
jgi:hypothetical protein